MTRNLYSAPVGLLSLLLVSSLSGLAQSAPAKSGKAPAPVVAATRPVAPAPAVKKHPDGRPTGVPWEAVKISAGAWRAMEGGKAIIYRQTAFGYSKLSEEENAKAQRMIDGKPDEATEVPEGMTVVEKDGKLHFTRTTPFGPAHWVKAKNELNIVERKLWDETQRRSAKLQTGGRN